MNKRILFFLFIISTTFSCKGKKIATGGEAKKPNIVIIYLDDLGYGDVGAYGADPGMLATPNMDRLANEGIRFTKGYASSATCTPSRYALLTGQYPWRNENTHILPGTAPLIIDTAQVTIPKMLNEEGYYTGVVGKWHLGLGRGDVDWNSAISPGPNEVGFDYSYIMAATQDRVPTVYIENGKVANLDPGDPIEVSYQKNFKGLPTGKENPELLSMMWDHGHNNSIVNGIGRIGFMKGGEAARWKDIDMADHFLEKAQAFVKENGDIPFFLYYALQQPHVPRTPHPRFVGATTLGPRGDAIAEADWIIGEFMKTLEEEGLLENTLIILSSDNGPVLNDGYIDEAVEKNGDHTPWGLFRGGKYSLFEAGTRVPFITYWKGKIQPGVSEALVSQIDILASLASLTVSDVDTSDSQDILATFLGEIETGREELILEAGGRTAYRNGKWSMIPPNEGPAVFSAVNIESGNSQDYQLYDLSVDKGQTINLADSLPQVLDEMVENYENILETDSGGSDL